MWFCVLILGCCFQNVFSELFTTYVNFEKYYQMEEELIALTDLIVQQERITHGEDVHGILNITQLIYDAKEIHNIYVDEPELYLSHPINTFHLSKRLAWQWKGVVTQIMETDTCVKALRLKIQNMDDNIPNNEQLSKIALSVLNLDKFYNKTAQDLMLGDIDDHLPQKPLTLSDVVYIAKVAYDNEQFYYAITWLNHVISEMKIRQLETIDDVYGKATIYNLLASAYFKMNHIEKAIELTDEIILFDPENEKASRNKDYYNSVDVKGTPLKMEKSVPKLKSLQLYNILCSQQVAMTESKERCTYFPLRNKMWYMKSNIKAEVIKRKPLIIYFHGLIGNKTANALRYMGHETLLNLTSEHRYSYPRLSSGLNDQTHWRWVPNLKNKFYSMDISPMPSRNSKFNILNVGLDGFVLKHQQRTIMPVGLFFVSLAESTLGGEFVFPFSKTKISVQKGDAVFYEGDIKFTVCPVAYGTQWYGMQYLFEVDYPQKVCPPKRRVRRGY